MRHTLPLLAVALTVAALAAGEIGTLAQETAAPAQGTPGGIAPPENDDCLSPADLREAVGDGRVVEPVAAIRSARAVVPRAEIQRAMLCRHGAGLVYMLTALRRDGHFVHVVVDAKTGKVVGQY